MTIIRPPPLSVSVVVVADVAVNEPLDRVERPPGHVEALAGPDIDRIGLETGSGQQRDAVTGGHCDGPAVDVHGMDEGCEPRRAARLIAGI
jgi:hypothetical protein